MFSAPPSHQPTLVADFNHCRFTFVVFTADQDADVLGAFVGFGGSTTEDARLAGGDPVDGSTERKRAGSVLGGAPSQAGLTRDFDCADRARVRRAAVHVNFDLAGTRADDIGRTAILSGA